MKLSLITVAALSVLAASGPSDAQVRRPGDRINSVPVAQAEGSQLWFVELRTPPVADGTRLSVVKAEQNAFRAAAKASRISYVERRSFNTLFNGFSVAVSAAERAKLARLPGVKRLHAVEIIPAPARPAAGESAPDLVSALTLTGANIAQNTLGLSGAGVKVGIIDSGVDIDHPAFGGSGSNGTTPFPTARITKGWDLVGDAYNADPTSPTYNPVPSPDANPDDCGGHGTHVAGIVGGNGGGVVGVAPQVTLGAYRVFGCGGSSSSDIILEAMERALADGMQVINQSLGASRQWPDYPTAQAAGRLGKKGVVMVASIGNNGPGGSQPDALFAAGAPGVGDGVIGVASFDNAQRAFSAADTQHGFVPAVAAPVPPTSGSLPMSRTGTVTTTNDACSALPAGSLTGTAVLIRRGTCGFHVKALNAMNAGAAAVVLYNNQPGAVNATVAGNPAITIPVVGVAAAQGAILDAAIANGGTTLTWGTDYVGYPFGTGGLISGFSSFGLAADLSLKPNIGAPGGAILSSYPLESGGTATLSGTSMSAPHVAGGTALILQALPNAAKGGEGVFRKPGALPPVDMMVRLQNTATPRALSIAPTAGLDHSFRQGAGMMDIPAAVQAKTFVTPSQLSLGEFEGSGSKTMTLTVRNEASEPITVNVGHVPAIAAGPNTYPNTTPTTYGFGGAFIAPAGVSLSAGNLVIPAKGHASFTATFTRPDDAALVDRGLFGGYISITPQGEGSGKPIHVPYAGFKGDYQSTVVLTPTVNGFPWQAQLVGSNYTKCTGACTFTMSGSDIMYALVHVDHHSRMVRMEALDGNDNVLGTISEDEYVGRTGNPHGFITFAWDGILNGSPVPNGSYKVKLSVLKALGDPSNPAHWETWTSPVATISRPL